MSVRHIVLFTLHSGITRDDCRVTEAAQLSDEHFEQIDDILEWWSGFNISERDVAADFAVIGRFADRAAVTRYLHHPHHQMGVEAWRRLADWIVIDVDEEAASHLGATDVHHL